MANEFYISAGLPSIDGSTGATSNSFYISAGLIPSDTITEISVSVTETISVNENVTPDVEGTERNVTVQDNTSLAESITCIFDDLSISIVDTIGVTASTTQSLSWPAPLVVDTVAVAEDFSVTVFEPEFHDVSVFSALSVSDVVISALSDLVISVHDVSELNESIVGGFAVEVNVLDEIVLSEEVSTAIDISVIVFDAVIVTEDTMVIPDLGDVSVFDTASITEQTEAECLLPVEINLHDAITVAEAVTGTIDLWADASEDVTIAESIDSYTTLDISSFDEILLGESNLEELENNIACVDNISISEMLTQDCPCEISTDDSITAEDNLTSLLPFLCISVYDGIIVEDAPNWSDLRTISKVEVVTVDENIAVLFYEGNISLGIDVGDYISTLDTSELTGSDLTAEVIDALQAVDVIHVTEHAGPYGKYAVGSMRVSFDSLMADVNTECFSAIADIDC